MPSNVRGPVVLFTVLGLCGLGGWVMVRKVAESATGLTKGTDTTAVPPRPAPQFETAPLPTKTEERRIAENSSYEPDNEAEGIGAFKHQRTVKFADKAAMDRFLAKAKGKGLAILGQIDGLHILRVGFLSKADLTGLLDGTEDTGFIYPVSIPAPNEGGIQPGAVGFGDGLLQWLGITGDNSAYGTGVKVAILDTGIASNSALANFKNIYLVNPPENVADWNGHGTAVADLIHQIAPAADLVSFRIAGDDGMSDTFLLSQGILAAIDQGVSAINISFGGGNSAVLRDAVQQAIDAGILIFASPGNEGNTDGVAYPAAYAGVVGVGAVDAKGDHLLFSNSGEGVSLSGPGLSLLAEWTNGQEIYFTGTSASSPVALGTLVALMSNGSGTNLTTTAALELLKKTLNDSGAPGTDNETGAGNVNLRVLNTAANVSDAAITSNYISTDAAGNQVLLVTVQNQGTVALSNTSLQVNLGGSVNRTTIPSLSVNGISTFTVPIPSGVDPATVSSTVQLSGGATDSKPSNNVRSNVSNATTTPAK